MRPESETLHFATVLGPAELDHSPKGLVAVRIVLPRAPRETKLPRETKGPRLWTQVATRLTRALARHPDAGKADDFRDVPLDAEGVTAFRLAVYRALQATPAGTTLTYGELAVRAGFPGAARAVGTAMAQNRWPFIIPCHRVLPSGRGLGRYGVIGGVALKERLLRLEGALS